MPDRSKPRASARSGGPTPGAPPTSPRPRRRSGTERLQIGTGIAVAFPRSPMVTAGIAWELAASTGGRFVLGLGSQVKAHIERRYSAEFVPPGPRMREYVESVKAIFRAFAGTEKLLYEGRYYRFSLLPPTWSPGADRGSCAARLPLGRAPLHEPSRRRGRRRHPRPSLPLAAIREGRPAQGDRGRTRPLGSVARCDHLLLPDHDRRRRLGGRARSDPGSTRAP
jgi:hypothetical protein